MEKLSPSLLVVISIAATLLLNIAKNYYCKNLLKNQRDYYSFNALTCAICAVFLWALNGFTLPQISSFSLWFGVLFGVVTSVQLISLSAALRVGPLSYTNVITTLSTIIPSLSGVLFWNEEFSPVSFVGMILMLVCFVLSVEKNQNDKKSASLKWFLLCLAAFLSSGFMGVMQKIHQSSQWKNELNGFLIACFVFSTVVSALIWLFLAVKDKNAPAEKPKTNEKNRKTALAQLSVSAAICVTVGVFTGLVHQLNLFLSGVIPAMIFFPIINGGSLLLIILVSIVIFKEKLTPRRWIGLLIGVIAVFLLCL